MFSYYDICAFKGFYLCWKNNDESPHKCVLFLDENIVHLTVTKTFVTGGDFYAQNSSWNSCLFAISIPPIRLLVCRHASGTFFCNYYRKYHNTERVVYDRMLIVLSPLLPSLICFFFFGVSVEGGLDHFHPKYFTV